MCKRKIFAALTIGGVVALFQSSAYASTFLVRVDDTPSQVFLDTYQDGNLIQHYQATLPHSISAAADGTYGTWGNPPRPVLLFSFDVRFNIFDPDGVTASDTFRIFGTEGNNFFGLDFFSKEGGPLTALTGAKTVTENGDWQTVFGFTVSSQDNYTIQFRSADAATPLPAALPLFASGAGVLGIFGWRRKKKAAALAA